jgi:uncharacterized protein
VFFSVKELELRKAHFSVTFPPGEIEFFDPALRQVEPLEAAGTAELLEDTEGEIRVRGRLTVTMEADCDRCLESAHYPIESEFDLFYRPAPPAHSRKVAEEIEIDEGEAELAFYEGKGLELKDILREHILLSMPMQRVCDETCRGICPQCGQNRNLAPCGCQSKSGDDRWEALKSLTTKGI